MALSLSQLAPLTTAAQALSNLVLVSPQSVVGYQPLNPPTASPTTTQPPAFLFQYEGEQAMSLESDITDHYIEDNSAISDQISLKPEIYSVQGFIGELNNVVPAALSYLKTAADKLSVIGAYTPQLSATAQLAYAEAFFLYQNGEAVANAGIAAWSSINNAFNGGGSGQAVVGSSGITLATAPQSRQQVAFQQLYGYWRTKTLFNVQTPWAVFTNMAIMRLQATQDEATNEISDFKITFKMIRTAKTSSLGAGVPISLSGRAADQAAGLTDNGTSSPVSSSSLSSAMSAIA